MRQRQIVLAGLGLAVVTLAAFAGVLDLGFVPLDFADGHIKYGFGLAADSQVAAAVGELRINPANEAAKNGLARAGAR